MGKEYNNDQDNIEKDGTVEKTKGKYPIHCLTIIGQVEGHSEAGGSMKTTKYEHVIPQLIRVQEDPEIKGLLIILNTVGGDVEAGLALSELICGMTKPTASLVLGGGHSIGIPLAVSADRSFIVPTATMTIHPVRHSGTVLGVTQTMDYLEAIQDRITGFVTSNSNISKEKFTQLMLNTGQLVMDVGTVLNGNQAVEEGLIDQIGYLSDALEFLYSAIEKDK
ncbi:MAG: ATP-dependent Clp protease proteolytic subunit [Oscillospiraceae bacterium]|jgi:ATP-dependent protease ClpP protease subunit|nr:ATP-dependent Clp protease proteolytic subunit [Oscillospiraceae bacterium]